jgi:GNAT superfamily N-acetyltransferase
VDLRILSLGKQHDRKTFRCDEPSLDGYLHRYASQDIRRRVNRVFIATTVADPDRIIAYYSLSAGSLDAEALPEAYRRRLPRYPVPVVLLGRLAVATSHQGQGVGAILLADALRRVASASRAMAVYAVIVDALHHRAADFYRKFGFIPLPSRPRTLFLPLDSVLELTVS